MATSPQGVAFANGKVRPFADLLTTTYWTAKKLLEDWTAGDFATEFPFDSTVIDDGAAVDGRNVITDSDVQIVITRAQEIVNYCESGGTASLTTPGNPIVLNQISKVQVNGHSIY